MEVANTLAYYDMARITAIKSFIVQAASQGAWIIKLFKVVINGTPCFKNVSNCLNINIYSYLETTGGQRSDLYFNIVHFSTPVLIRHLWQLKTVVFLHWCLLCALLLICCLL